MHILPLIVLGPTATGKSALALELAARRAGEIVSLDSMQIYQGMDIGTAKPTIEQRRRVPHHLIDCQPVTEPSDVAAFLANVAKAEMDVAARGAQPILVGGTAMYIKALVDGLFDAPESSREIRSELMAVAEQRGSEYLHRELLAPVDPATAAKVHPNDLRRVVRAIEVFRLTGKPISAHRTQWPDQERQIRYRMVGLTMPRDALYRRIEARVDGMIEAGLIDEVRRLKKAGIEENPTASQAIGYKELLAYLKGEYDFDRAVELIKRNTRRFAKHQFTWFRKDERIAWFDVARHNTPQDLADAVEQYLAGEGADVCSPRPQRM